VIDSRPFRLVTGLLQLAAVAGVGIAVVYVVLGMSGLAGIRDPTGQAQIAGLVVLAILALTFVTGLAGLLVWATSGDRLFLVVFDVVALAIALWLIYGGFDLEVAILGGFAAITGLALLLTSLARSDE
jgi:hypothetical protein